MPILGEATVGKRDGGFKAKKVLTVIPEDVSLYIEKLDFETYARMSLCLYMIQKNQTLTESYNKIFQDYLNYFTQFNLAKRTLWENYLQDYLPSSNATSWYLDYTSYEVYIYE